MRKLILFCCFMFFASLARAQTGTLILSVSSSPTSIVVNQRSNYVVIEENSATPSNAYTITLPGQATGIVYAAGSKFVFSAGPNGYNSGQTLGTITIASGTVQFIGIESLQDPTLPSNGKSGGGGGGGGGGACGVLAANEVLFGTGLTTCSVDSNFQWNASTHILTVTANSDSTSPFRVNGHSSTQSAATALFNSSGSTSTSQAAFNFIGNGAGAFEPTATPALVNFQIEDATTSLGLLVTNKVANSAGASSAASMAVDNNGIGSYCAGGSVGDGNGAFGCLSFGNGAGSIDVNTHGATGRAAGNTLTFSGISLFQLSATGQSNSNNFVPVTVKGAASQAVDIFDVKNSAGTVLFGVGSTGGLTATALQTTGTPANSLCTDSMGNVINFSSANCFGGGGGGAVLQTNGINNLDQTVQNIINGPAFNGLTPTITNTSGGIVQLGLTGALGNGGLANPSTTVNGQGCTLGATCNVPFTISGTPNTSLVGLNFIPSTTNSMGITVSPANPASNQVKFEATGTVIANSGGTGKDFSACTGVIQVASGTFSCNTALANGTTATTQATNDATTKVATGAAVQATTSLPSLATVGTIGTGTWHGTAIGALYGGTAIDTSGCTGVPHVTAGTWACGVALPNGTTATTQANGDTSTDLATDAFVLNNTLTNPMRNLGDTTYGGAAGAVTQLAGPTGPNGVAQNLVDIPSAGAAVAETWALPGIPIDKRTTTTETIAATDRGSYVSFNNASAIAVTLPQAGTTGFTSNFVFVTCDIGAGTATITPTTSTISYTTGSTYTSGASSLALATAQCAWVYSDNTNYFATVVKGITGTAGGDLSGTYPNPTVVQVNGAVVPTSAAVLASNGSNQLTASTPHQVTLPLQCADTSASATTYTCTTSPSLGALTTGDTFILTGINQNNSGSSTLNIDTIGAKTIKKWQNTANLGSGDLQMGATARLTYDGTFLELDTIGTAPSGSGTVGSCATTGAVAAYGTATSTAVGCGNADFTIVAAGHTFLAGASGLVDLSAMSGSNALKIPSQAGLTSDGTKSIGYDTVAKNTHIPANGADALAAAESAAMAVNCIPKSSSSTVALLICSGATDDGSAISASEPFHLGAASTATTQTQGDNSTNVATTAYTDLAVANAVAGVNPAVAVLAASTASLTGTYSNGASGIGATFTITATGAFTLDGVSISTIGQRVLLKNQSSAFQNGVYTATVVGTTGVSPVFTRALDYDTTSDINTTGAIPVQNGTVNTTTSWLLTSTVTTIGTDALTYVQFSINPTTLVTAASPGVGLCHFAGSTQACTSSAVVGADMTNNTVTATQLAAQYSKRACSFGLGDSVNAVTAATYPASGALLQCVNNSGVTWTITGIHCFTDNAGTSTIDVKNNAGTSLLTGAVTCNATKTSGGAAGTQSATTTIATTDGLNFVFVADGTSKYVTATVDFTY